MCIRDSPYGDEIKRWELVFNQDLDGDSSIGEQAVTASDLYQSLTDGHGGSTGNHYLAFDNDPNSSLPYDTNTYILSNLTSTGETIKIVDSGGYSVSLNDDWGNGQGRKAWAVEANSSGYLLTIKSTDNWGYGDVINWEVYQLSVQTDNGVTTAIYDWSPIYSSEDISSYETIFAQDLNEDGNIGLDTSDITDKSYSNFNIPLTDDNGNEITVADTGDILATNNEGDLFIKKSSDSSYIKIVDYGGFGVQFDQSHGGDAFSNSTFSSEAQYVELYDNETSSDTSDDKYLLVVRESSTYNYTGGSDTDNSWVVYEVNTDGTFDWMGNYGVSIKDWEVKLGQDIDGDGSQGVSLENLAAVSTDISPSSGTTGGVLYKSDETLFIKDGETTLQIKDYTDYSDTWEGGSYSAEGYAVEKQSNGNYLFAIKFTDTFSDGYLYESSTDANSSNGSGSTTNVAWEIREIYATGSEAGYTNWNSFTFTTSISGYEPSFNQDMNADSFIGTNLGSLTNVSTDTTGYQLKVDSNEGSLFIWDGSDSSTVIQVVDDFGGAPSYNYSYGNPGDDYYSNVSAYAVYRDTSNSSDNHYKVAIKYTDSFTYGGTTETNTNWEILKVSTSGVIDYSGTIFTDSITSLEDEFGQDMNDDGDASGQVTTSNRSTDTTGTLLAQESGGGSLFIVDGSTKIQINDSYIESSSNWGDGNYKSVAIAVSDLNNNGTSSNSNDDYYQLAVKQTGSYTNYDGGTDSYEDWQIYAIDTSGNIDWGKTVWTESIQPFEVAFDQDLDGDNVTGLNLGSLTTSSWTSQSQTITDIGSWKLQKDSKNCLYIINAAEESSSLITVTEEWGGAANFDYSHNWGSGSSSSQALAAEQNADGTFSIAIRHSGSDYYGSYTDYEILQVSASGVISYSDSVWTQDIKTYETNVFGQDIDGDGSAGRDFSNLTQVSTDSTSTLLYKDSSDNSFFIKDGSKYIPVTEEWGGSAQLQYSYNWGDGSSSSVPIAVEKENGTDINSDGDANGYFIAIKHSGTYGSDSYTDWQIMYTNSKGVIDYNYMPWMQSIQSYESDFGQDLDGDNFTGLNIGKLISVSTDTTGDLLKKDSAGSLYIVDDNGTSSDNSDDITVTITDEYGSSPYFDYSYSGGSGNYAYSYSSAAFAVEALSLIHI